ncbi:male-enhanced antigen 1-like [Actinia tenebrosa]|uniref:Male-enhanced antigen 1 n=1 Tax=Actinia tenebrosa TaxID=6105 RepID=A0A6P8HEI1_ACTTE|nr:male-enhanced antigen 1-like [Actinia tenebrosa]
MTPQISPKDVPQDRRESEEEEEPVYGNIVQESSSSGEDDEEEQQLDASPQGYIPLSMNDASETSEAFLQELKEDSTASESHENQEAQIHEIHGNQAASRLSDSQHNDANEELPMDNDKVNLIQQVMSKIALPPSSIPEWANVIPEDKWKNSLLTSLEKRTHLSSSTNCNETDPEK